MRALDASLSDVLGSPGVVGAALVDAVTGLSYQSAGDHRLLGTGAELAELTNLIGERLYEAGAESELESLVVTSTRHHQVVQVLSRKGDPLLLATVLDRERTNLALALRQTADRAQDLLA
ncbi:hypothetical protein DR950_12970 [Kitasatospora xanthocidica]|uniref:Roadblock/LC7 domain-containing protein n=1 Tax=Kitasatospora xanthocidica TaxID=83382 RepID=A0A372ZTR2_9ACTN|nr:MULTISPECIES: hypothetical protein [Streptomycetaceae]OKI07670.1 hypothetical protein AMK13_14040 [Streptomyces sp. CB02056]RGD58575.1 hypothetical protein DR950_12970 [Kitasatospora xanthocidica]